MQCHIHFKFPDKTKIKNAFTYNWRLWTMVEIRELLSEAGFANVVVYWEGEDEDGDQREEGEDEGEVDEDARADDEAFEGLLSNPAVASGIEQSLLRRVRLGLAPPSFCTRDAAAYASWLAEDQVAAPVGKRIGAPWSVQRAGEAGGEGGGGKDMFELYRGDTSDVLVQEMLARLTAVAMWYINGASLVDVTDPKVGGGG